MINPRTSDCKECAEILPLIDAINCKLFESAIDMYNNLAYSLNLKIPATDLLDLLNYKRILINKYVDMNYACDFSINQIANRVRILTTGCLTCVKAEMVYVFHKPSTTTSTTSSSSTTTTTTAVPTFFLYSTSVSNCGSCDFPTQPSLESDVELEVGKYYYSPTRRKPAFISALLASGTDHIGTHSFDPLTKSDTCEEIVCPTTTTTTTII